MTARISVPVVVTAVSVFGFGLVTGALHYLNRSRVLEKYVPGSSAITIHVVLAAAAVLVVASLYVRKRLTLLRTPFTQAAFARFTRTLRFGEGISLSNLLRLLFSLWLAVLFLYNFWRAGDQVIGGLDPNYVVNAWGGPSYWGASLAHWLDTALLVYAQAALLNIVMVRRK